MSFLLFYDIDHNAILWCRQLIHSVTGAMRALSKAPNAVRLEAAGLEVGVMGGKGKRQRIDWYSLPGLALQDKEWENAKLAQEEASFMSTYHGISISLYLSYSPVLKLCVNH